MEGVEIIKDKVGWFELYYDDLHKWRFNIDCILEDGVYGPFAETPELAITHALILWAMGKEE